MESLVIRPPVVTEFHRLCQRAEREANSGQLQKARQTCELRVHWANLNGDDGLRDQAFCGLAAVHIALGEGEFVAGPLRRVLKESSDQIARLLAAHAFSQLYLRLGQPAKSIFYSRCALHHARSSRDPRHLVRCLNALAAGQGTYSQFGEAEMHLRVALEICRRGALAATEPLTDWLQYVVKSNLGSSLVLQARPREGLALLFDARRHLARQTVRTDEMGRLLNLAIAFAYLHADKPRDAYRHASEALVESQEPPSPEIRKRALFVLGEACKLSGVNHQALHWYGCLQRDFYADMPDVTECLLRSETRELVNPWI